MSELPPPPASDDHDREHPPEIDSDQPADWEDGDRLNEAFAAISDDPLAWAEHQAEMRDWTDWGGAGDHLPD